MNNSAQPSPDETVSFPVEVLPGRLRRVERLNGVMLYAVMNGGFLSPVTDYRGFSPADLRLIADDMEKAIAAGGTFATE